MAAHALAAVLVATLPRLHAAPAATVPASAPAPIAPQFFGMHMHGMHKGIGWPDLPVGAWRLWDAHVTWRDLQPQPQRWRFETLDHAVALAMRHGAELLLPLGLSPRWASSRPDESSAYGPGHAAPPRDASAWARYVQTVAQRYRGRIAAYEIWNEPNAERFFSGSVEDIVRLTCSAREILRREDPDARLVSPSATHGEKGVAWLDAFLAAGGGRCVDVIGFHFYTLAHEPPEALVALARRVSEVRARHGLQALPVWNTESGWYLRNATRPLTVRWHSLDDASATDTVARALLLAPALGIERFYWYAWDDGNLGLLEMETLRPKPAASAYATVARWITGTRAPACDLAPDPLVVCRYERNGRVERVVWSRTGVRDFQPPEDWQVIGFETLGEAVQPLPPGGRVRVGPRPVRLERAR